MLTLLSCALIHRPDLQSHLDLSGVGGASVRRFGRNKKQELAAPESPAASVMSHASSGQSAMSACSSDDVQPFPDDHASTSAASEDTADPAGPPSAQTHDTSTCSTQLQYRTLYRLHALSMLQLENHSSCRLANPLTCDRRLPDRST